MILVIMSITSHQLQINCLRFILFESRWITISIKISNYYIQYNLRSIDGIHWNDSGLEQDEHGYKRCMRPETQASMQSNQNDTTLWINWSCMQLQIVRCYWFLSSFRRPQILNILFCFLFLWLISAPISCRFVDVTIKSLTIITHHKFYTHWIPCAPQYSMISCCDTKLNHS